MQFVEQFIDKKSVVKWCFEEIMFFWWFSDTSSSALKEVDNILERLPQRVTSLNGTALKATLYKMVPFQARNSSLWGFL